MPSTGRIGFFKIISESAIAAGVRRIEAITATAAEQYVHDQLQLLASVRNELKNAPDPIKAIQELQAEIKNLRQQMEDYELQKAAAIRKSLVEGVEVINGIKTVSSLVDINDQKLLKSLIYQLGQELGEQSFLLLGAKDEGKAQLMLFISEDLVKNRKMHAGNIIKELAKSINGGGGGQPFFASAGGTSPEGLQDALKKGKSLVEQVN